MGTGGDSDDDPMGMIPSSGSGGNQNEVQIKSNQFEAPKTHEIETQYEPPAIENQDFSKDMLLRMEKEMTKGMGD